MLAKGLAGPLLLGMIIIGYLLTSGAWRRLRVLDVAAATAAAVLVASTWYVPVFAANGWPFIQEFFVDHHFRRYLTNRFSHPQPVYFFALVLLAGVVPWTFVFLSGLKGMARVLRRQPQTDEARLVWIAAWSVAVPLVFFSLSTSKLPGYILPVFPGLALLTGWAADRIEREDRGLRAVVASSATLVAVGIALGFYGVRTLHAPAWEVILLAALPASAALVATTLAIRRRWSAAFWTIATGGASIAALIVVFLFGELGTRESLPVLMARADASMARGELVLCYGVVEFAPAFYLQGRVVVDSAGDILIASSRDEVVTALGTSVTRTILVITDDQRFRELSGDTDLTVEALGTERNRVLLRATPRSSADSPAS
jgi:4-amino-4-deoxy-L-arabinose transferase-like glycosyltransferase